MKYALKDLVRALRVPFLSASVLPFVFGAAIERHGFHPWGFLLGLGACVSTHLSSNLINDYADSKSGADWQDRKFYQFFGGSKLIQEKVFSEKFYFRLALGFACLAAAFVTLLCVILKTPKAAGFFLTILFLGWSYSEPPLKLSYRRLGEIVIFLLFGPALVMGGYFTQTGVFPDLKSFILSLPFGLLTANILFSNELPDLEDDRKAGKLNWVSLTGPQHAYLLYLVLLLSGFFAVAVGVSLGYLRPLAILSFISIIPAFKAAQILKARYQEKDALVESSKLTIMAQTMTSLVLIVSVLL